ncbi:MAG TPA: histidine phosphatase family protein [Actinomycetota bacterium]|nr:histidine phosphatase family protein [Actinomycetota bacterium]
MDLYLVRHAVAFSRDPTRWPDDGERPLTPKGEARFRKAARGVRRIVTSVDVVLSSPFPRAWRTAELLEEEAGWPAPKPEPVLEAGRSPAEGMEVIEPHLDVASLALVGHEPYLSELASILLTGSPTFLTMGMKKGGMAHLWLEDGLRRGTASLRWLVTPKALRALSG